MDEMRVTAQGLLKDRLNISVSNINRKVLISSGNKMVKTTRQIFDELKPKGFVTGALRDSFMVSTVYRNRNGYDAVRVGTKKDYAAVMNYGRTPGKKQPPKDIIKAWIQAKGVPVPTGMTIDQFAFLVARKIGVKGTLALKFMELSIERYKRGIYK